MISENSKAWLEAAKRIAANSNEKVACPTCGYNFLKIEKVPWPNFDKVDIYMLCEKCGSRNVITTTMLHSI